MENFSLGEYLMLLLVIDSASFFKQQKVYQTLFGMKSIIITSSLDEAEKILLNSLNVGENKLNLLLISKVLIDTDLHAFEELKKISDHFSGSIILKVKDEMVGLSLIKQKLITDFYLADKDPHVEMNQLLKVFETVSLKDSIKKQITHCSFTINELKEIEKCL